MSTYDEARPYNDKNLDVLEKRFQKHNQHLNKPGNIRYRLLKTVRALQAQLEARKVCACGTPADVVCGRCC